MKEKRDKHIKVLQIGNVWVKKTDLTREEMKHINEYEVCVSFQDLGNRGNFSLIPKIAGLRKIVFKNGSRERKNMNKINRMAI